MSGEDDAAVSAKVQDVEEADVDKVLEEQGMANTEGMSFIERLAEVFVGFLPLGLIAFGGPAAHIGILQQQFVEKRKWLDTERFVELMSVGQGLPGPTSTQMVVAIGATRAGIPGGLVAFVLWNLPSFIVCVTVALLAVSTLDETLPDYLIGLPAAATSLVFLAAYSLGVKVLSHEESYVQKLKIALATASTVGTLLITGDDRINNRWASLAFPVMLIIGGVITVVDSRRPGKLENYFTPPTEIDEADNRSILKNINISPRLGLLLFITWIVTLVSFIALRSAGVLAPGGYGELFEAFFRTGSIIYGGGQVVLPMLLVEVVETGWLAESDFFIGFGLVQSLPGPLFNFSSYLGAVYKGIVGALVAWVGLFGPGLLLIFAFLPLWMHVRRNPTFKCFLAGVNAAAIGLIVAACAQLWEKAVNSWASTAVFVLTGSLIRFFDVFVPLAILIGGLVGFLLSPTGVNFAQGFS
ncbi:Hypothetical Protein FCC1311_023952 [Hondaea fermentalgiana]|uniref:Chromate transport protein n=1 Tax=Hondaea fermentalgiana TaxID=2315210 RepID=A0A2R5G6L9_9STRA|nr:Hypothetical Protein FCC1311_023952 [Hondaea fermentalgiana]|eukprot:GBG26175.1 Hypothetical Protein FCC1311_023952 [Hondaea fermentalgiana]